MMTKAVCDVKLLSSLVCGGLTGQARGRDGGRSMEESGQIMGE